MEKRITWIDNLKAVGIFLVVLAHHNDDIPKWLLKYIYSFHVPLFFFASGLVYYPQRYTTTKLFFIYKTKTLLVPYFVLSFLTYAFYISVSPFRSGETVPNITDIIRGIESIFISSPGIIWMAFNPPLWFLTSLFVAETCFFILHKAGSRFAAGRTRWVLGLLVLLMSIMGVLGRQFLPFRLPWTADTALTGSVLFAIGFLFKDRISFAWMRSATIKVLLAVMLFSVSLHFSHINGFVNLAHNRMGNYLYFYIAAFSGIGFFTVVCSLIPINRALNYVGRNTLLIMGLHIPAFIVLNGLQKYLLPGGAQVLTGTFAGAILCTIMQIIILLPIIYIVNRNFRFILGRK